jgi:phospholipase C
MGSGVQHVFVLMLENRSFDHMLGYSAITGTDASDGTPTAIRGLRPLSLRATYEAYGEGSLSAIAAARGESYPPASTRSVRSFLTANDFNGGSYAATQGADYAMPLDPGHEFPDVVTQLAGPGHVYSGGAYPNPLNDGFVASYVASGGGKKPTADPAEIMKCYNPAGQLPVLNQLASEFVVCDNWHAPLPGPTWPNRFFAHAASSGGLDHSPSTFQISKWELEGYSFARGTLYDQLRSRNIDWKIYAGDAFPIVGALRGVHLVLDIKGYDDFAGDVAKADYPYTYTFIEPNYGHLFTDFKCGTSQHPLDDVTRGEQLIKATYEAIRNSPVWNNSVLILTWDEHGGFYDHLPPPGAVAPGDTTPGEGNNQYGFTFQQYGPRVPAVIISPLIPGNLIDHRLYDHSSIPRLMEDLFGLGSLTGRDANSNRLSQLLSLNSARTDTPARLLNPIASGIGGCDPVSFADAAISAGPTAAIAAAAGAPPVTRPDDPVDEGSLPGFLYIAMRAHAQVATPAEQAVIRARVAQIRTRRDAANYIAEVEPRVRAARAIAR